MFMDRYICIYVYESKSSGFTRLQCNDRRLKSLASRKHYIVICNFCKFYLFFIF